MQEYPSKTKICKKTKKKGLPEPEESSMYVVAKQFHLINPSNLKMWKQN